MPSLIQIQYLKHAIPANLQAKVSALLSIEECWARLGKFFGNKIVNLITIRLNLLSFTSKGSLLWERVPVIFDEVGKAVNRLSVAEVESKFKEDYELVFSILTKFDSTYPEEWNNI